MPLAFRARYVFTAVGPPLQDSAVNVDGGRVLSVGEPEGTVRDLGDVAIVPGLVNAHIHLEFSDLGAPLGRVGMSFVDWIRQVVAWRQRQDPNNAERRRETAILRGLAESQRYGVRLLGEIATLPFIPEPLESSSVDAIVFLELLGLAAEHAPRLLDEARNHLSKRSGIAPGISPHAPYTVGPSLLHQAVQVARQADAVVAMHLAESVEELELLRSHSGPFVEFLSELDVWHPSELPIGTTPLDYLRILAESPRALVVHGNYLTTEEIDFLSQHRKAMSVVYCPRTHAYFGHQTYPLAKLLAAEVNVAVGTDSRASNPDLDLWQELRWVAQHHSQLAGEAVLRLGTLNAARALGCEDHRGSLEAGKLADFLVVPLAGDSQDPYELLFDSAPTAAT